MAEYLLDQLVEEYRKAGDWRPSQGGARANALERLLDATFFFLGDPYGTKLIEALIVPLEGKQEGPLGERLAEHVRGLEGTLVDICAAPNSQSRCYTVWEGSHVAYRCYTCALSGSSCICIKCFKRGDHEGHDFMIYRSDFGGCCDCGDASALYESGFCARHTGPAFPLADLNEDVTFVVDVAVPIIVKRVVALLMVCPLLSSAKPSMFPVAPTSAHFQLTARYQAAAARHLLKWIIRLCRLHHAFRESVAAAFKLINIEKSTFSDGLLCHNVAALFHAYRPLEMIHIRAQRASSQLLSGVEASFPLRRSLSLLTVEAKEAAYLEEDNPLFEFLTWLRTALGSARTEFWPGSAVDPAMGFRPSPHAQLASSLSQELPGSLIARITQDFANRVTTSPLRYQGKPQYRIHPNLAYLATCFVNQSGLETLLNLIGSNIVFDGGRLLLNKDSCEAVLSLLLELMFVDDFKHYLGPVFLQHYPRLAALVTDSPTKSVIDSKFLQRITVQVFAIESVCHSLVKDHNMVSRLMHAALDMFSRWTSKGKYRLDKSAIINRDYNCILHDLRYFLESPRVFGAIVQNNNHRDAFWRYGWLPLMMPAGCCLAYRRELCEHVKYDDSRAWIAALLLHVDCVVNGVGYLDRLVGSLRDQGEQWVFGVAMLNFVDCYTAMVSWHRTRSQNFKETFTMSTGGTGFKMLQFNIAQEVVLDTFRRHLEESVISGSPKEVVDNRLKLSKPEWWWVDSCISPGILVDAISTGFQLSGQWITRGSLVEGNLTASTVLPLHRVFTEAWVRACVLGGKSPFSLLSCVGCSQSMLSLVSDEQIRALALYYQVVLVGAWRRNGQGLQGEATFYMRLFWSTHTGEIDLLALRLFALAAAESATVKNASSMDAVELLIHHICFRLDIPEAFIPVGTHAALDSERRTLTVQCLAILLFQLLAHESRLSWDPLRRLEQAILQNTTSASKTHSQLLELMPRMSQSQMRGAEEVMERAIDNAAVFQFNRESRKGSYVARGLASGTLEEEVAFWSRIDISYPFNSEGQSASAELEDLYFDLLKRRPKVVEELPPFDLSRVPRVKSCFREGQAMLCRHPCFVGLLFSLVLVSMDVVVLGSVPESAGEGLRILIPDLELSPMSPPTADSVTIEGPSGPLLLATSLRLLTRLVEVETLLRGQDTETVSFRRVSSPPQLSGRHIAAQLQTSMSVFAAVRVRLVLPLGRQHEQYVSGSVCLLELLVIFSRHLSREAQDDTQQAHHWMRTCIGALCQSTLAPSRPLLAADAYTGKFLNVFQSEAKEPFALGSENNTLRAELLSRSGQGDCDVREDTKVDLKHKQERLMRLFKKKQQKAAANRQSVETDEEPPEKSECVVCFLLVQGKPTHHLAHLQWLPDGARAKQPADPVARVDAVARHFHVGGPRFYEMAKLQQKFDVDWDFNEGTERLPRFGPPTDAKLVFSCCGHKMHEACWKEYLKNVSLTSRPDQFSGLSCPYCSRQVSLLLPDSNGREAGLQLRSVGVQKDEPCLEFILRDWNDRIKSLSKSLEGLSSLSTSVAEVARGCFLNLPTRFYEQYPACVDILVRSLCLQVSCLRVTLCPGPTVSYPLNMKSLSAASAPEDSSRFVEMIEEFLERLIEDEVSLISGDGPAPDDDIANLARDDLWESIRPLRELMRFISQPTSSRDVLDDQPDVNDLTDSVSLSETAGDPPVASISILGDREGDAVDLGGYVVHPLAAISKAITDTITHHCRLNRSMGSSEGPKTLLPLDALMVTFSAVTTALRTAEEFESAPDINLPHSTNLYLRHCESLLCLGSGSLSTDSLPDARVAGGMCLPSVRFQLLGRLLIALHFIAAEDSDALVSLYVRLGLTLEALSVLWTVVDDDNPNVLDSSMEQAVISARRMLQKRRQCIEQEKNEAPIRSRSSFGRSATGSIMLPGSLMFDVHRLTGTMPTSEDVTGASLWLESFADETRFGDDDVAQHRLEPDEQSPEDPEGGLSAAPDHMTGVSTGVNKAGISPAALIETVCLGVVPFLECTLSLLSYLIEGTANHPCIGFTTLIPSLQAAELVGAINKVAGIRVPCVEELLSCRLESSVASLLRLPMVRFLSQRPPSGPMTDLSFYLEADSSSHPLVTLWPPTYRLSTEVTQSLIKQKRAFSLMKAPSLDSISRLGSMVGAESGQVQLASESSITKVLVARSTEANPLRSRSSLGRLTSMLSRDVRPGSRTQALYACLSLDSLVQPPTCFQTPFTVYFEEQLPNVETGVPHFPEPRRLSVICLLCGTHLCADTCCSLGSATRKEDPESGPWRLRGTMETRLSNLAAHTWLCGMGSGLYLNLATSSVDAVMCTGGRLDTALMSSQLGSVYLDKFGEEDPHVSRGRLLKLSHCRWAGLNQMWMAGGLRWGTRPWPESEGIEWAADLFQ